MHRPIGNLLIRGAFLKFQSNPVIKILYAMFLFIYCIVIYFYCRAMSIPFYTGDGETNKLLKWLTIEHYYKEFKRRE